MEAFWLCEACLRYCVRRETRYADEYLELVEYNTEDGLMGNVVHEKKCETCSGTYKYSELYTSHNPHRRSMGWGEGRILMDHVYWIYVGSQVPQCTTH